MNRQTRETVFKELRAMNDIVRPAFEYTVGFVKKYLRGIGYDMGCGACPLLELLCTHYDAHPQPLAVEQVGSSFEQVDVTTYDFPHKVDYIFSSHMVEDLPTEKDIIDCLVRWCSYLKYYGNLVLLLPDMQGGRYPTVEEGGNPSHRVNVGRKFIEEKVEPALKKVGMSLVQIDTIPHDKCATIDAVFTKEVPDEA